MSVVTPSVGDVRDRGHTDPEEAARVIRPLPPRLAPRVARVERRGGPPRSRLRPACTPRRSSPSLRRRYRGFVFPATIAFLAWYLLYVVLSNWAGDLMGRQVVGNVNVALVFGLLQFVTTFVIAWLYSRYSNAKLDPLARETRRALRRPHAGHAVAGHAGGER
ncbi:DUF485 domain-containing protein [Nocardioides convexus]|uniref:DUF485 domain-containing protein n=1 Tax=Nocardioides convexus TaxID=2712224 RepID=UPI00241887D0|nr:DUF485 domain-containing protein [Nocardioides convexus]